jgi:YVTN family beta-propeller protein
MIRFAVLRELWRCSYSCFSVTVVAVAVSCGVPARAQSVAATVSTGTYPYAIAVNPATNTIYVANEQSANVTVIDGVTNTMTALVPTGNGPWDIAVNPATNTIYVPNAGSDNVTVINGATNATSTVAAGTNPNAIAVNSVTNTIYVANSHSNNVTAAILPPSITTQPTSQLVASGGTAKFSLVASSAPGATYQWQVSTDGGTTWTALPDTAPYSGTATALLTITGATTAMSGYQFECVIGDGAGTVTSSAVFLDIQRALQSVTLSGSFDFVNGIAGGPGSVGGGDLYFVSGEFFCNNFWQRGVVSLGNLGNEPFDNIVPPATGYTSYGVPAIVGNTYVALISTASNAQYAIFRVTDLTSTSVTFEYQVYVGSNQPLGFLIQPGADCFWASAGPPRC